MYRGQQYSQIYFVRLHMMRTLIYSLVPHWKPHVPGMEMSVVSSFLHLMLFPALTQLELAMVKSMSILLPLNVHGVTSFLLLRSRVIVLLHWSVGAFVVLV